MGRTSPLNGRPWGLHGASAPASRRPHPAEMRAWVPESRSHGAERARGLLHERLASQAPLMGMTAWPHVHPSQRKMGPLWAINSPARCGCPRAFPVGAPQLCRQQPLHPHPKGCQSQCTWRWGGYMVALLPQGTGWAHHHHRTQRVGNRRAQDAAKWKISCKRMRGRFPYPQKTRGQRPGQ